MSLHRVSTGIILRQISLVSVVVNHFLEVISGDYFVIASFPKAKPASFLFLHLFIVFKLLEVAFDLLVLSILSSLQLVKLRLVDFTLIPLLGSLKQK